jgi:hypothetical protein
MDRATCISTFVKIARERMVGQTAERPSAILLGCARLFMLGDLGTPTFPDVSHLKRKELMSRFFKVTNDGVWRVVP